MAYMTFDRPELRADQPLTLIAEAARQLSAVTSEDSRDLAWKVERQARDSNRRTTSALGSRSRVATSTKNATRDSRNDLSKLARQYADIVRRSHSETRVLWVLDTFEVAQRIGEIAVDNAFALIDTMQAALGARFRVVVAGRIPIDESRVQPLTLEGLDRSTARQLLDREVGGLGLSNVFLDDVLGQLGTNPLSLRLAGELLRQEGRTGLRGREARQRLLFHVGNEEIQGVLYRRILDHLDDEEVRKIANPGLVVRRIDAGVIREVLARPCHLGTVSAARANDLVERLGREASLVEPAGPGAFVHRADVRAIMLPLIEREDKARAAGIRRAAVKYYAKRYAKSIALIDKTEELYHRLMLAQPAKSLTAAWDHDAALMLQPALDEFPPASQAYLAERLGWTVDPEVFRAAEDDSWAEQAARLCRQRLSLGDAQGALTLARERASDRVRPKIDPIIVEALATLGQLDEALAVADRTIGWALKKGDWPTFVAVSVMAARVAEDSGQWNRALELLQGARDASHEDHDRILHLAAGVAILRVQRRSGETPNEASAALRASVLDEGRALRSSERRRNPTLVRDLAAEFGSEAPDFVATATELVGMDLASEAGSELIGSLSGEDRRAFNDFTRSAGVRAANSEPAEAVSPMPPIEPGDDLGWLGSGTSVEQSSRVNEYLENISDTPDQAGWTDAIASGFRVDSDASPY
jgi:tetratricopeptide (TPR) repeat protein